LEGLLHQAPARHNLGERKEKKNKKKTKKKTKKKKKKKNKKNYLSVSYKIDISPFLIEILGSQISDVRRISSRKGDGAQSPRTIAILTRRIR
jgi:hypothetical protein